MSIGIQLVPLSAGTDRVDELPGVELVGLYLVRQELSDAVKDEGPDAQGVLPFIWVDQAAHHAVHTHTMISVIISVIIIVILVIIISTAIAINAVKDEGPDAQGVLPFIWVDQAAHHAVHTHDHRCYYLSSSSLSLSS